MMMVRMEQELTADKEDKDLFFKENEPAKQEKLVQSWILTSRRVTSGRLTHSEVVYSTLSN